MVKNNYSNLMAPGKSAFNVSYIVNDTTLSALANTIISGKTITGEIIDTNKFFQETSQYLSSIKFFPFDLSKFDIAKWFGELVPIAMGNKKTGYTGYRIPETYRDSSGYASLLTAICEFDFTDINKFTFIDLYRNSYKLYLPYYRYIELEINKILGYYLKVYLDIDFSTGMTTYYLTLGKSKTSTFENEIILNTYPCKLYLELPVGRNSSEYQKLAAYTSGLSATLEAVKGGASMISSIPLANPMLLLYGGTTMMNSMNMWFNSFIERSKNTSHITGIVEGNASSWNCSRTCFIVAIKQKEMSDDYNQVYAKQYGRLLNKNLDLQNVKGFTVVKDPLLEGFGNCTKNELDEIKNLLGKGVIFE